LGPSSLTKPLKRPDAEEWIRAAFNKTRAHLNNGTWEHAPGRRAIGSRWVFEIKRTPEGHVEKYKGRVVAQGSIQIPGVHWRGTRIYGSFAAVRTVIAIANGEELELETVGILTVFLNREIDTGLCMRIPEPRGGEVFCSSQPIEE